MNVNEVTRTIVDVFPDATLVSALGTATASVREVTGDGPHFYFGGAMGSTLAAALGLAEAVPHRLVVAVLGDGDFLMGASSIWSLSACQPGNLVAVVLADGQYAITGGQPITVPLHLAEIADVLDSLSGRTAHRLSELRDALTAVGRPGIVEARISEQITPTSSPFIDPATTVRNLRNSVSPEST